MNTIKNDIPLIVYSVYLIYVLHVEYLPKSAKQNK